MASSERRIGPYELVRELGRGGFAEVWLARRTGPGGFESRVAIKLIKIELRTDPSFQKMFLDEAKLAARISHPNVASIFELGEADDVLYLVMEYVAGRPLNELNHMMTRAGKPIPVGIVMRILADTCAGLHAAHELERDGKSLGVIHRDVSPQNILVSDKGAVKLIDFGVAKANDRLAADTTDGVAKGKLRYMAPEQALARPVDRRADVWAVGAVAFDMIEGHPPYDGHNDLARLFKLMDTSPPPTLVKNVPAPIASVIRRALERDPDARWATAADMRIAIEAALDECGLRVTADTVTAFFGDALADRGDDRATESEGAGLRARLQRPSSQAGMATVDVPVPDAHRERRSPGDASPNAPGLASEGVETLSAIDTRPRGVPRRPSRVLIASIAGGLAVLIAVLAVGLGRAPTTATTTVASPEQPSLGRSTSAEPAAPPSDPRDPRAIPEPTPSTSSSAEGVPSDNGSVTASSAATPQAKPGARPRGPRPRSTKPTSPGASQSARPRYDDTIQ